MSDAIVCERLVKTYGTHTVVKNLTLRVPENIVFGFLGPNGAGKSTTMKILTGQIKPTSGKAWVAGAEVATGAIEARRQIGYLSELPNFYPWMKGQELLEFAGEIFGLNLAERRARAKELLKLVGLEDAAKLKIAGYSGGMRQRLGIAQALVNRPKVIFLDEPVSALDPIGRRDVLTLLDSLRQEASVFMSSHVLADVDRVCEMVAILYKGELMEYGATTIIKERYATAVVDVALEGGLNAAQTLADCLKGQRWVKNVIAQNNGRLKIELIEDSAMREAGQVVPRLIADLNLSLLEFQPAIPNLEDVFMKVVSNQQEVAA